MSMASMVLLSVTETEQDRAEARLACIRTAIDHFGQQIAPLLRQSVDHAGAATSETDMQHYHRLMLDLLEEMFGQEIAELEDELRDLAEQAGQVEEREARSAYLRGLGV